MKSDQEQNLDEAIDELFADETIQRATAIWQNRQFLPEALREDLELAAHSFNPDLREKLELDAHGLDPNQSYIDAPQEQTEEIDHEAELQAHKQKLAQQQAELEDRKQMFDLNLQAEQEQDGHEHEM